VFGRAHIATATWALLYVVLSLDPAIRDEIHTASQVAGNLARAAHKLTNEPWTAVGSRVT
jgi:hypothetical protein